MCILIIDDDSVIVDVCEVMLNENGYEVERGECVADAVRLARETRPDLILMDIMMPGVDGARGTRMLKNDLQTKDIPVLVMTGCADESARSKALEYGAESVLSKPFNMQMLLREIDSILSDRAPV